MYNDKSMYCNYKPFELGPAGRRVIILNKKHVK